MEAKVFIPKCAKCLAKFVRKDTFYPVMTYVMLDAVRGFLSASNCFVLRSTTTRIKPRHRANLAAKMTYSKTNIYPGVSPPRKNVYFCAKTHVKWEKQRLRSRERTIVAGKRKCTYPLQE